PIKQEYDTTPRIASRVHLCLFGFIRGYKVEYEASVPVMLGFDFASR
ncbi:MAG: hypothetical protein ACI8P0_006824, partial [Planctomycetaceae bacterium]